MAQLYVCKLYMVSKALMEYAAFTCAAYESCKFPEIFFSISSGNDFSMLKVHRGARKYLQSVTRSKYPQLNKNETHELRDWMAGVRETLFWNSSTWIASGAILYANCTPTSVSIEILFFTTQRALLAFARAGICHWRNCNFVSSIVHHAEDFASSFLTQDISFPIVSWRTRVGEEHFSIKINKKSFWLSAKQEKTTRNLLCCGCYVENTKRMNFLLI